MEVNKSVSEVFEYLFSKTDDLLTLFGTKKMNREVSVDIEIFVVTIAIIYRKLLTEYPELIQ
jgi:hypothetical protein